MERGNPLNRVQNNSSLSLVIKQERNMLTRILNRTKNEIKPTKKWDNEVIKMVERYDARKKIKKVSQR